MTDEKKELETVSLASGKKLEVDPALLLDCYQDVEAMVKAHTAILTASVGVIAKATKAGMDAKEASELALELQRRAGQKANSAVHMGDILKNKEAKTDEGETENAATDSSDTKDSET